MASMTPKFHLFPEHYEDSTNQPTTTECSDPLKNFQICGSGCPGHPFASFTTIAFPFRAVLREIRFRKMKILEKIQLK